jgi:hypothetical protein
MNTNHPLPRLVALALAAALAACGGATPDAATSGGDLQASNGLSMNGLSMNGLSMNGLAMNGLSMNGLAMNGLAMNGLSPSALSTNDFSRWFNQDPATADMVMRYLVRCSWASGATLSWTNLKTKVSYAWPGLLGLAPAWASGKAATEPEQQIVTACLASLANKFGRSIPISVLGRSAAGTEIPVGDTELATYSVTEGCFFGNIFAAEGVFVGLDHQNWSNKYSSPRACALDAQVSGPSAACPPFYQVGYCHQLCVADPTGTFFESCTWNGKSYRPIATRLTPDEVYACGDGICQFTESCGTGASYDACKDCGTCL